MLLRTCRKPTRTANGVEAGTQATIPFSHEDKAEDNMPSVQDWEDQCKYTIVSPELPCLLNHDSANSYSVTGRTRHARSASFVTGSALGIRLTGFLSPTPLSMTRKSGFEVQYRDAPEACFIHSGRKSHPPR